MSKYDQCKEDKMYHVYQCNTHDEFHFLSDCLFCTDNLPLAQGIAFEFFIHNPDNAYVVCAPKEHANMICYGVIVK